MLSTFSFCIIEKEVVTVRKGQTIVQVFIIEPFFF